MPRCIVIQPFDGDKFDKRFEDTYKPALEEAGLEAYRVDRDFSADVPIDTIEKHIRDAGICLADITTDNPNVWYELGYAFASHCLTIIIVCSNERNGKLPFDIQHRHVIEYKSESSQDFEDLRKKITERARELRKKSESQPVAAPEQVAPREGLSQRKDLSKEEIQMLGAIASATVPWNRTRVSCLETRLTKFDSNLALWQLEENDFVKRGLEDDPVEPEAGPHLTVVLTRHGWNWIAENKSLFSTHKGESDPGDADDEVPPPLTDDEVPF